MVDDSLRVTLLELENADLRLRLKLARDLARSRLERLRKRRVPVVLEVEPTGDVTLYAENGTVELAIVEWPKCEWNASVEEWLSWQLGERHRALYAPSRVEARVNGANCTRTLAQAYEAYERMLDELPLVKALVDRSKREREFFTPKGKKDAQKKAAHRGNGAAKRRA